MTTTLNEDEFDEGITHNYEPHNIVYGNKGWTDVLDDDTLGVLLSIGAVRLERTVRGPGFETRIFVSTAGKDPQ